MSINDEKVVEKPKKKIEYLWTKSMRSWLRTQNRKAQQAQKKRALLNDKSWKDTRVSKKQKKKASPTSSTNKEKENHWGTCKCNRKVHWYLDMSR
jgi:hypothetical protein